MHKSNNYFDMKLLHRDIISIFNVYVYAYFLILREYNDKLSIIYPYTMQYSLMVDTYIIFFLINEQR
jgi:hypothetical protein